MTSAIVGIDIAKDILDVALLVDNHLEQTTVANTSEGTTKLLSWLRKHKVNHVHACMEATGTYGEALALALHDAGHSVSVVNPARIAAYAKSHLARNKTDALDAQLIARFCLKEEPPPWKPPHPNCAICAHLCTILLISKPCGKRKPIGSRLKPIPMRCGRRSKTIWSFSPSRLPNCAPRSTTTSSSIRSCDGNAICSSVSRVLGVERPPASSLRWAIFVASKMHAPWRPMLA